MSKSGWPGCWAGTAPPTPATSSAPCSSSSSGWPPRRTSRTRWPGCGRRTSRTSPSRSSPTRTCRGWNVPARAGRSSSAATPPSSPCSPRPGSGCPNWPGSGTTRIDPRRSDIDLWHREITVRGKGRKTRTVKISYDAARSLDRYLRARARHAQACRPQLWLGVNDRGPMTASGIYQVITRRGRECGVEVFPHRFRHHFSHTWLDRGGAEGDLMELNGWTSPQMLRRYGASARSARARRSYDRIMDNTP